MITTQPHFETFGDYLKYLNNSVGELQRDRATDTEYYRDTALCAVMRDSVESSQLCTKSLFPIPYSLFPSAKRCNITKRQQDQECSIPQITLTVSQILTGSSVE